MSRLNPDNLTVEYLEGTNERAPLIPRRYTFTRSEDTTDLFLIIGSEFVYDKIGAKRNDVLGEWLYVEDRFRFYVYLHMSGEQDQDIDADYYNARLWDLLLALEAIHYGDKHFFASRPELDQYPIIVYFLFENPEINKEENWGTFSDYEITTFQEQVVANSLMEHRVLIDEKFGDLNGDGFPDRVSVFGDKMPDSDFIHSIIIEAEGGQPGWFKVDMITEVNGINPTIFLGDFTKDKADDILFRMDMMFNSMNSKDKGEFAIAIHTIKEGHLETIFVSDRYNLEYAFLAEYSDQYRLRIMNIKTNKLFILDISNKGHEYLSQFYSKSGELIKPVQGMVLKAEAFVPVVSNQKENFYDLLAVHRIIGDNDKDTLGYIENLLSWDGERFVSIQMLACTPGTDLIIT